MRELLVMVAATMAAGVVQAQTVFQVDMNMTGDGDHQAGWSSWATTDGNNGSSLSDVFGGIGVTVTATGSGYITARGGSSKSRSTSIAGTSWNDMVEDLWAAVGDGDMTIALTGLSSGTLYTLTAWHNDSYSVNAGFASEVGYAITPSVTLGTLCGLADAGASSNNTESDTLTDASFDTSVIYFKPDGTGAATIVLDGASTFGNLFALSGLQLESIAPPPVVGTAVLIR